MKHLGKSLQSFMAAIVIPVSLIAAYLIFTLVLGDSSNFVGGDNQNEPLKGNYLGVVFKGGPIVILLISFQIILVTYIIERFLSITKATGKSKNENFVRKIKSLLATEDYSNAIDECDKQKGSVASVIKNGLSTFNRMVENKSITKEQKLSTLQQDIEEATQLELPQLNNNMIIIATLASISTLIGLLGTVTGMIKAFSALARVGAPDAVGLANGISQALVTTALGISTAAVAIVFYNYFTSRIDNITYAIDEAAFSIISSFKVRESKSKD